MKKLKTCLILFVTAFFSAAVIAQKPELTLWAKPLASNIIFSQDGKYFAGYVDNNIMIWESSTGRFIRTFSGHTDSDIKLSFSPDGKHILSGAHDGIAKLWDFRTGEEIWSKKYTHYVNSVDISPNGRYALITCFHGRSNILELLTGVEIKTVNESGWASAGRFSPGGNSFYLAVSPHQGQYVIKKFDFPSCIERPTIIETDIFTVITISRDGKYLLVDEDKGIELWNLSTNKTIQAYGDSKNDHHGKCTFLSDSEHFIMEHNGDIEIREITTGEVVKTIPYPDSNPWPGSNEPYKWVRELCSSPDGALILISTFENLFLFDPKRDNMEKLSQGITNIRPSLFVSHDFSNLLILTYGKGYGSSLWNLFEGRDRKFIFRRISLGFSKDSKSIYKWPSRNTDSILKYDISTLQTTMAVSLSKNKGFKPDIISKDERYIRCSELSDRKWRSEIYDFKTGKRISSFNAEELFCFSPDSRFALSGSDDSLYLWNVFYGQLLWKKIEGSKYNSIKSLCYSPDGKSALTGELEQLHVWDIATGHKILEMKGHDGWIETVDILSSGNSALSGGDDNDIILWNIRTGERIRTFTGHSGPIISVEIGKEDKSFISSSKDGTIKFWDITSSKERLTLIPIDSADWVLTAPDGRFDASPGGMKYLYYVKGVEVIPLESLYEQFYTPGLWRQVMGGEVPEKQDFSIADLKLPPEVRIVSPQPGNITNSICEITVEAKDKGDGIDEVRLYHNGKLVDGTERGFKPAGAQSATGVKTFTLSLMNGENVIRATAFNYQRTESNPVEIRLIYNGAQANSNMYILAIGINTYFNPKYNLNYAVKDAEAFRDALQTGAKSIFANVNVTFIKDALATKQGILAAVSTIKAKAQPQDVFVFYYAGHGVMSAGGNGERPEFFLVPYNVTKMYEADEMLKEKGISAKEISEFARQIKAQKQLFVLDACQSGGAMQSLAMRGAAEEKAIAQLARSTGTYFIAASGTEQFATEVGELGHGIFTYCVIESLKGSCKAQDGKVTVNLLKGCVESKVPELTQKYRGQPQFPTGYGFGQDFPISVVK